MLTINKKFTRLSTLLRPLSLSLGALALTSCATQPPASLMDVQAEEVFVLNTPIRIEPNRSRSFIQFGQLSGGGFDHSEPHCRIEVRTLSESPQTIQPERFTIERVTIDEEMIALQDHPIQLALNGSSPSVTMSDAPSHAMLALRGGFERIETMDLVHLYLQSEQQPDVYRLTCAGSLSNGSMADAPRSYRPQRQKIQQILGEIGQLERQ